MAFWSIGVIRGQYQPEDFTESQETKLEEEECAGGVTLLQFKEWGPREISLSFVVDGSPTSDPASDPETAWKAIQAMQRPPDGGPPQPIGVVLPCWGAGENRPAMAIIVNSSIKRTHVAHYLAGQEAIQAIRATISVTLRELAGFEIPTEGRWKMETA